MTDARDLNPGNPRRTTDRAALPAPNRCPGVATRREEPCNARGEPVGQIRALPVGQKANDPGGMMVYHNMVASTGTGAAATFPMIAVEEPAEMDAQARRPSVIRTRYGTVRGMVRLLLSYPQTAARRAHIRVPEPGSVRRLVYVCQGNICRSAFADVLTRDLGFDSVSFGLSTDAGKPAHPPATTAAADFGVDLSAHATTRVEDYNPRPGDFLLAMEVRQLARIAADPRLADLPRSLLGLWARPVRPHLHDPFGLDDLYMRTCMTTIRTAVTNLVKAFPGTRLSA